jgi:hypothetical protein
MTPEQAALRSERVALMVIDGGCTEEESQLYCDKYPIPYGVRDVTQTELFKE